MKQLLSLLVFISFGAMASQSVTINISPDRPVVISADSKDGYGNDILAPWFHVRPMVINSGTEEVTVSAIQFGVQESNSTSYLWHFPIYPLKKLAMGEAYEIEAVNIDKLPEVGKYNYNVKVFVLSDSNELVGETAFSTK